MVYAKQIIDSRLVAILTYDYVPEFGEDSETKIVTKEEYEMLLEEMIANRPEPDPNRISDRKALEIITGGEV